MPLSELSGHAFGLQMRVALQHPIVSMAANQCNLGDGEAGFEEPADRFMSNVVEPNVLHAGPCA